MMILATAIGLIFLALIISVEQALKGKYLIPSIVTSVLLCASMIYSIIYKTSHLILIQAVAIGVIAILIHDLNLWKSNSEIKTFIAVNLLINNFFFMVFFSLAMIFHLWARRKIKIKYDYNYHIISFAFLALFAIVQLIAILR